MRTLHVIAPRRTPSRNRLVNTMLRIYYGKSPLLTNSLATIRVPLPGAERPEWNRTIRRI